ncbi:hypothetical protein ACFX13_009799 [Malus domestica]
MSGGLFIVPSKRIDTTDQVRSDKEFDGQIRLFLTEPCVVAEFVLHFHIFTTHQSPTAMTVVIPPPFPPSSPIACIFSPLVSWLDDFIAYTLSPLVSWPHG